MIFQAQQAANYDQYLSEFKKSFAADEFLGSTSMTVQASPQAAAQLIRSALRSEDSKGAGEGADNEVERGAGKRAFEANRRFRKWLDRSLKDAMRGFHGKGIKSNPNVDNLDEAYKEWLDLDQPSAE